MVYDSSDINSYPSSPSEGSSTENQEENGNISGSEGSEGDCLDDERRANTEAWLETQKQPQNITEAIENVERLFGDGGEGEGPPNRGVIAWLDTMQRPERITKVIEAVESLF